MVRLYETNKHVHTEGQTKLSFVRNLYDANIDEFISSWKILFGEKRKITNRIDAIRIMLISLDRVGYFLFVQIMHEVNNGNK